MTSDGPIQVEGGLELEVIDLTSPPAADGSAIAVVDAAPRPAHEVLTADGVRLAVRHWTPSSPSTTGIVLAHGYTATKDAPEVVATAEALCLAGHHVIAHDARGHGASDGMSTLGHREAFDVAAASAVLAEQGLRVVLVGASMGAIASLRAAAACVEVEGVVSVSSPARWRLPRTLRGLAATLFTQTPPGRWFLRRATGTRTASGWARPSEPIALASRLGVPLVVLHGAADRFLERRDAHDLHTAATGPCQLRFVDDMGHAFDAAAVPAIVESVDWILSQRPELLAAPDTP